MRKITLLFAVLLSLAGVTTKAETADFENALPEGWEAVGTMTYYERPQTGSYSIGNSTGSGWDTNRGNYIKTTKLDGEITLWLRSYKSGSTGYVVLFKLSDDGETVGDQLVAFSSSSTTFAEKSYTLTEATRLAIVINYAHLDNMTYEEAVTAEGPALAVKDGSTKLTSGYAYNFGLATAGTTKTFTLSNPGTENLGVSVSETGSFGATLSASTIVAGGEATLTVTMPNATGSSAVTIIPDASGIESFVINVSGTIKEANKVFVDFTDGKMPDDWSNVMIGSYGSGWAVNAGYASHSNSASSYYLAALTSPLLKFIEGENLFFNVARYGSSTYNTSMVKVQTSADGSTWTDLYTTPDADLVYGEWKTQSVAMPAGSYYIRFYGGYANITNIYGGELPNEPKMKVTQPASLDFGAITEATDKTFTIANTGKATLEGINVTSSNSTIFAVTGAPASLGAGASAEVTITMAATTTGALSSDITVSATGMDDVQFTVTGVVLPEGLMVVDFNDNLLPANWGNEASNKWSFSDGNAYCTNAAELTTPKLQFAEGDMLAIKVSSYDDYDNNYLEITGSVDGTSWDAFATKKYISRSQIPYGSYATLVIADIPATVKYLKFKGYYVRIDEIAGLTYAPVLSVTKDEVAVAAGDSYDFGESAADATVTYNFANAGAGTINITNVAITGDGAAAYSTNWSASVAAPFDLVITRAYDSSRTGAQAAVVTATTTEGDFVINVTGTDKAANDPELAVAPAEDAAFGVVTEAATKTYTVTNAGTGTLTVSIASDNEMFTVSAAELTDIAAGESKTFDVTFTPAAETYGVFTANITVKPSYDEAVAVTIVASAKVKDPSLWSEDFAGNALPTGWDAGSNWTFADGVAKAEWTSSSTYLTTPTLSVSGTDDELTFDYKTTAGNVNVKIQMSKDNGEWTTCTTTPPLGTYMSNGTSGTATITGLEPGVYQFRFANDDYELDNFEGFQRFVPEHKTDIMASNIPESQKWNMTMKESKSFEATVTLKENAGKVEAVKAELYMGEDVIGSVEATLEAYGNTTLTITATPATAATEGAQMYIKVTYAGGELTTAAETRYVAALTYLTLDETSSEAVVAGTYDHVTLKRTFAKDWNTVCLPFTVSDVEAFFGTGAKAFEFKEYTTDGELSFGKVTTLKASYPYIVFLPEAIAGDIALTDITIASNDDEAFYKSSNNVYFHGTYAPLAAGGMAGKYGVTDDARIRKGTAEATIKGFRAYFVIPEDAPVKALVFQGDLATDVRIVPVDSQEVEGLFDLAGRRVQKAHKGIFIQNGKKVVVK